MEEKRLTSEELHKALKQVGAYFCTTLMVSHIEGVKVPEQIERTMDDFMVALPQLAEMIDAMDHQLDIEKREDGGTDNG